MLKIAAIYMLSLPARTESYLILNWSTDSARWTPGGREFQGATTRCEKKFRRSSSLHGPWESPSDGTTISSAIVAACLQCPTKYFSSCGREVNFRHLPANLNDENCNFPTIRDRHQGRIQEKMWLVWNSSEASQTSEASNTSGAPVGHGASE